MIAYLIQACALGIIFSKEINQLYSFIKERRRDGVESNTGTSE